MNILMRQGSWVITSSLIVLATVYLAFMWIPTFREIRQMQAQVESRQIFLTQAAGLSKNVTAIQQELDRTEAVASAWESAAPHKKDISELYGKINAMAKDSGLQVTRFDPQPFVEYESLQEIPVSVVCTGVFSQLYEFLREIEGLPEPIRVSYVKIEKMMSSTKGVQCEISLAVYSDDLKSSDYTRRVH